MTTLARQIADRVCAMQYADLPAEAIHWAKVGVLDFVGVTLAGFPQPCSQVTLHVRAAPGPALVFGSDPRLAAPAPPLVNPTASHPLSFHHHLHTLGDHPTPH